jgi:hypothetical protein
MGLKVNQGKTSTCQYPQEEKDGKLWPLRVGEYKSE